MSRPTGTPSLWVRMRHWIPVEAGLSDPVAGEVLRGAGLRAYAALAPAAAGIDAGFVRCAASRSRSPGPEDGVEYVVDGTVAAASDVVITGRRRRDAEHSGVDVVLDVDGAAIQVQTDGSARDVPIGSRMSVRGELEVIPFYEWTDFGLVDTRADWSVEESLHLADGDLLLRLRPPSAAG